MLRAALIVLLVVHGLIHVFGFTSAYGMGQAAAFQKPVTHAAGLTWLLVALLFVGAAVLVLMRVRWWPVPAALAVVLSQVLIFLWWKDAKFGTIANVLLAPAVLVAIAAVVPSSSGAQFRRIAAEGFARVSPQPLITEVDLAHLPAPVQRYLRFVGVVGKPRVVNLRATFRGTIAGSRDAAETRFTADQVSFFDQPTRLFFIESARSGVPYDALHAYVGPNATMRVKVASLATIVDAKGPEMNRSETVTMFNDMCVLAPATLIDPAIEWTTNADGTVTAAYENAGNRIQAVLTFGSDGELTNFVSNDRSQTSDGKSYATYPWSTPVRDYRDFHGFKLATHGQAIWHEPGGDFTYGHFELVDVHYNVDRL